MHHAKVEVVVDGADQLGEVPLWCGRSRRLWWVDVRGPALQSYDPASARHECWRLPEGMLVGSFGFRESGGFILGTNAGFHAYTPGADPVLLVHPEPDQPQNRLNDGRCDRRGRYWCGSMHATRREPTGSLYRLDPDRSCHAQFDDVVIPNSINWSPDDRRMYFADSTRQLLFEFDFDIDDGVLGERRVFSDRRGRIGLPDGSAVDEDGCVWNAEYGGGVVVRYSPRGEVLGEIALPATQLTSCAFGGPRLDTLYVTSAVQNLDAGQRAAQPHAGALFAVQVAARGLAESRFGG